MFEGSLTQYSLNPISDDVQVLPKRESSNSLTFGTWKSGRSRQNGHALNCHAVYGIPSRENQQLRHVFLHWRGGSRYLQRDAIEIRMICRLAALASAMEKLSWTAWFWVEDMVHGKSDAGHLPNNLGSESVTLIIMQMIFWILLIIRQVRLSQHAQHGPFEYILIGVGI